MPSAARNRPTDQVRSSRHERPPTTTSRSSFRPITKKDGCRGRWPKYGGFSTPRASTTACSWPTMAAPARTPQLAAAVGHILDRLAAAESRPRGRRCDARCSTPTGRVMAFTDADLPFELPSRCTGPTFWSCSSARSHSAARDLAQSTHPAREAAVHADARYAALPRGWSSLLVSRGSPIHREVRAKAFSRRGDAAQEIFSRLTLDGFAFDAEVVFLTEHSA